MYTLAEFSIRRQRSDKGKKRNGYTPQIREKNIQFLYKNMYGGDKYANELAKNPNNKLNKITAKQYILDIAANYEDSIDNKNNRVNINKVNRGINSINKRYGF